MAQAKTMIAIRRPTGVEAAFNPSHVLAGLAAGLSLETQANNLRERAEQIGRMIAHAILTASINPQSYDGGLAALHIEAQSLARYRWAWMRYVADIETAPAGSLGMIA